MSITIRLWNDADLLNLESDDNLLTVFFNRKGYSEKELKRLYELTEKRKTYFIFFTPLNEPDRLQELSEKQVNLSLSVENDDYEDCIRVHAVSDESLRWFLKKEYHYSMLDSITEVVSTTREVSL